ncbi:GIY-YIG nuclease family protein [Candidatus Roizmanbacteria bacterium]|nr:GIY-YIG nuclease family protein [Candidatus Roizmanbacteria bacterium]
MKHYHVYILTNKTNKVLYTGVTNDLLRRMYEHRAKLIDGFTKKYNLNKLVYFEEFTNINEAIAAEKKIKGWLRIKKIKLIESKNPKWTDLFLLLQEYSAQME